MQPLDRAERLRSAAAAGSSRPRSPRRVQPCWHHRPDGTRRRHRPTRPSRSGSPPRKCSPGSPSAPRRGRHPGQRAGARGRGPAAGAHRHQRAGRQRHPDRRAQRLPGRRGPHGQRGPACGIDWSLLAGIGRVESNHGRFGGATLTRRRHVDAADHRPGARTAGSSPSSATPTTAPSTATRSRPRRRPDAVHPVDLARRTASTPTATACADPFNINDAALAAAHYLCAGRRQPAHRRRPARGRHGLQPLRRYVTEVLGLAHAYASGIPVADIPLVGNTTAPVPPASGNYGAEYYSAPASPSPAIGASDHTPATPGSTVRATPAGTKQPGSSVVPVGSFQQRCAGRRGERRLHLGLLGRIRWGTTLPAAGGSGSGGGGGGRWSCRLRR